MGSSSSGQVVVDVRGFNPALRSTLIFALVDKMVEMNASDQIVLVCDHEPAGLGYQIDMRRETRGRFRFSCDRRSDGAWVALVTPIEAASEGPTR